MGGPVCNSYQVVERFSTTPNARWYSSPENQKQVYFVMNPVDR